MFDLTPSFYSIKDFHNVTPLVRLWSLRALVVGGAYRKFALVNGFSDSDVAAALGFVVGSDDEPYNRSKVLQRLREMLAEAEQSSVACQPPEILARNLTRLADLIGLNEVDRQILCLVSYLMRDRFLETVTDMLGQLTFNQIFDAIAAMLTLPVEAVRTALGPDGTLIRSGTVILEASCASLMRAKLDVLSDALIDSIHSFELETDDLLKGIACRCTPPVLKISDYDSVQDLVALVQALLKGRVEERCPGTNIFIYGSPGTGKSQLVRVIAQTLELPLFEVAAENNIGMPVDGERRLRALTAAQSILNKQPALLLFDEIEDSFKNPALGSGARGLGQRCKAWMNRMLENNPVPTFWVSNSAECLDPAYIRRFDIVLELPNPSPERTEQLIQQACAGMVSADAARRIASHNAVSPAMISRASSIVSKLQAQLQPCNVEGTLEKLINATLKAQGIRPVAPSESFTPQSDLYDPRFVNAEIDVEQIARGLKTHRDARILLWGGPGTGKTAFGQWLSEKLAVPLHVKRGSDLLSKMVGETERNLSHAFAAARKAGAVLLIDEVDSFMFDRSRASHTWEVTLVNEMLTQLESFDGVFIATTNLLGNVDPASLRRFDLVAGFDWLKPEQVEEMLIFLCQQLELPLPDAANLCAVRALRNLAPGDFAAIRRQSRFRPLSSVAKLVHELQRASTAKGGDIRDPMGFLPAR